VQSEGLPGFSFAQDPPPGINEVNPWSPEAYNLSVDTPSTGSHFFVIPLPPITSS